MPLKLCFHQFDLRCHGYFCCYPWSTCDTFSSATIYSVGSRCWDSFPERLPPANPRIFSCALSAERERCLLLSIWNYRAADRVPDPGWLVSLMSLCREEGAVAHSRLGTMGSCTLASFSSCVSGPGSLMRLGRMAKSMFWLFFSVLGLFRFRTFPASFAPTRC